MTQEEKDEIKQMHECAQKVFTKLLDNRETINKIPDDQWYARKAIKEINEALIELARLI